MRGLYISISIFVIIIISQFLFINHLSEITESFTGLSTQIEEAANSENWTAAAMSAKTLKTELECYNFFLMSTIPHEELDSICLVLEELEAFIEHRSPADVMAITNQLTFLFKHISYSESLVWENIF